MKRFLLSLFTLIAVLLMDTNNTFAQNSDKVKLVTITTEFGEIVILPSNQTPKHRDNFLKLASEGFYNGTTFHRIIKDFMIQGGDGNSKDTDTNNDGMGNIGYMVDAEIVPGLYHKRGAVCAARTGDQMNPERKSSGSQFYIVLGKVATDEELDMTQKQIQNDQLTQYFQTWLRKPENEWLKKIDWQALQKENPDSVQKLNNKVQTQVMSEFDKNAKKFEYTQEQRQQYKTKGGTPFLDNQYTVFGEVIKGIEIADKIVIQEKDQRDRPTKDIKMTTKVVEMTKAEVQKLYGYIIK